MYTRTEFIANYSFAVLFLCHQVFLDWSLVSQMFVSLIHFSLESPHSLSVDHAARGCGSIANRATDTSIIERELVTIWGVVCDNTRAELSRVNMLTMLLWVS